VGWELAACPHCGEEFEPELDGDRFVPGRHGVRRDTEPHRGPLLSTLGNVCLVIGGLSVCICGLGAVVSVPLGIVTWVLAQQDLTKMRQGLMDARGKDGTESGRTGAILGIVLGVIFAACHAVWWLKIK
jgi:hypothetical protein